MTGDPPRVHRGTYYLLSFSFLRNSLTFGGLISARVVALFFLNSALIASMTDVGMSVFSYGKAKGAYSVVNGMGDGRDVGVEVAGARVVGARVLTGARVEGARVLEGVRVFCFLYHLRAGLPCVFLLAG